MRPAILKNEQIMGSPYVAYLVRRDSGETPRRLIMRPELAKRFAEHYHYEPVHAITWAALG